MLLASTVVAAEVTLYVAPSGSDEAAGTQQAPLATLDAAKTRVRQAKEKGDAVTVVFAAGTYFFSGPVAFSAEDSGTEAAGVTYKAADGAEVRFTGGREVKDWQPVTDAKILARLDADAKSHIQVADLQAQGITDLGKIPVQGFTIGVGQTEAELFYADRPMTIARWPNEGFLKITGIDGMQKVKVDTDRIARWTEETDPWIFAYWHHDWAEICEPLAGVDPQQKLLLRTEKIKPIYGITPSRSRWYALNLLSELDTPGEYYIDRTAGRLYFWPPSPGKSAVVSTTGSLIKADNLSYVTFQGLTLECSRSTPISLKNGTGCKIVGCTIRNAGTRGLSVSGGTKHEVYGCDVYYCGSGGISMAGGERKTLTPAGHNAENNHVHHYSRRARTYQTAITVSGVGNRIAHNLVHDGPHMALSASGNDHIVEYNEIHNVVEESGDAGAYYVGRDWTQRGNILRYNYWHQIVGAEGLGGMTIYLDDQHCGHTIYGNLFERCSRPVFIGGGDDNHVSNNVFIDCWRSEHIDSRGLGWQKKATDDPKGELRTRLAAMPYQSDLWKQRYPNLAGILEDDPNTPKRNVFEKNVSAGGIWDDIDKKIIEFQTIRNNLAKDDDVEYVKLYKDENGRLQRMHYKDPAAVRGIGFKSLPIDKMGVYEDPRRASWPVEHTVRKVKLPHDADR